MTTRPHRLTWREQFDLRRFFRGERAVEGPVRLGHRRIFILPNRYGFGLALLLLIQTLVATNYSNNLAFILSFLMASIALVGILHGFRNLEGLVVRPGRVEPVFAGADAIFELCLENRGTSARMALKLATPAAPGLLLNVPPANDLPVRLPVPVSQRGWITMPTLTISSTFPLGLFRAWSPLNLPLRALVYPAPASIGLPFPEQIGQGQGQLFNADDFHGFQNYQPGDSLRRVHWKGVAKGQPVMVKEYRGERQAELLLDWDQTPGLDVETRLSQLCRWVLDAERAGLRYGLRLPGLTIAPAIGLEQNRRCLEALALYPQIPGTQTP
jgi:uncharacterized protein (DUF58 family)